MKILSHENFSLYGIYDLDGFNGSRKNENYLGLAVAAP